MSHFRDRTGNRSAVPSTWYNTYVTLDGRCPDAWLEDDAFIVNPSLTSGALRSPALPHADAARAAACVIPSYQEHRMDHMHPPAPPRGYERREHGAYPALSQSAPQQKQQQATVASSLCLIRPDAWNRAPLPQPLTTTVPNGSVTAAAGLVFPQSPLAAQLHAPVGTPAPFYQYRCQPSPVNHRNNTGTVAGVIQRPTWSQVTRTGTHLAPAPKVVRKPGPDLSAGPRSGAEDARTPLIEAPSMGPPHLDTLSTCSTMPATSMEYTIGHRSYNIGYDTDAQQQPQKINNAIKLLSESLSYMAVNPVVIPNRPARHYPVVRLSNIPWTISIKEIKAILRHIQLPNSLEHAQSIHVIIDKITGKTQSDAFVEVATQQDAINVVKYYRHPPVKGRKISISSSSHEELMANLFPDWPGIFIDALIPRREIENLLDVCRNFKAHFSRKCGERPFENFVSLLIKFPWDQPDLITTMQRDHLYEYYKLATNVLKTHLDRPYVNLDPDLMTRMIRAALQCPGFTVPQKKGILTAGNAQCPNDLLAYIEPPCSPTITADGEL